MNVRTQNKWYPGLGTHQMHCCPWQQGHHWVVSIGYLNIVAIVELIACKHKTSHHHINPVSLHLFRSLLFTSLCLNSKQIKIRTFIILRCNFSVCCKAHIKSHTVQLVHVSQIIKSMIPKINLHKIGEMYWTSHNNVEESGARWATLFILATMQLYCQVSNNSGSVHHFCHTVNIKSTSEKWWAPVFFKMINFAISDVIAATSMPV